MTTLDITQQRLHNQHIAGTPFEKPGDVVRWLGAVQAQDYLGALWTIGLRSQNATEASIEQAIADKTIVRTWPMRGTLHFVAPEDIRWMLKLLTPSVIAGTAARYRQLELDDADFARSETLIVKALQRDQQLTRNDLYDVLEHGDISSAGQRGIHILSYLAQAGLICFGPRSGKQPTFVLLDEWLPAAKELERDEALAELAKCYFTGHGPATLQDFIWWTGLKVSDAKAGLNMAAAHLAQETINDKTYWMAANTPTLPDSPLAAYLLPGFDEYMLGYTDRSAALDPLHKQKVHPGGNGVFSPTIILKGRVVGTWKRVIKKGAVVIESNPFNPLSAAETQAVAAMAQCYGQFLGMPVTQP